MNQKRIFSVMPAMMALFCLSVFSTSCSDSVNDPPQIRVFVDGKEVTSSEPIAVTGMDEIEYRFEVEAFCTITDLKTVFFDITLPHRKTSSEVLVGGLSESRSETVRGVYLPENDTEIMLIVKDIGGNESAGSFSLVLE